MAAVRLQFPPYTFYLPFLFPLFDMRQPLSPRQIRIFDVLVATNSIDAFSPLQPLLISLSSNSGG